MHQVRSFCIWPACVWCACEQCGVVVITSLAAQYHGWKRAHAASAQWVLGRPRGVDLNARNFTRGARLSCSRELEFVKCTSLPVHVRLTPLFSIACILPPSVQLSGTTWWEMADSRPYYVPSGGALCSASSNQPPVETRQLQSSLRAGRLQRGQSTAAGTGLLRPKGQRHVSWAGDVRSSPAASVATPKASSSETQPVVVGVLQSTSIVNHDQPSSATDSQMSNGSNTVAAAVRHRRLDLYQH